MTMTTIPREVSTVKSPGGQVVDMFLNMAEEEFLILWRFGGFHGQPPQDVDRRIVAMVKGFTARARRDVGRAFARAFTSTPPQVRAALVALLLALVGRPAAIALPAPTPRALSPQRRCHRPSPARAP